MCYIQCAVNIFSIKRGTDFWIYGGVKIFVGEMTNLGGNDGIVRIVVFLWHCAVF